MAILLNAAGGLALFMLAMSMMTSGLRVFAGIRLKTFLQKLTASPVRGVLSGALVTGLVQSSSAVTVTIIGFVNAGILNLQQALGVVFGANIGTTMTGWLVSLVGFGFKIEALAMPVLAAGVLLGFTAPDKRYQSLGKALTGFGLFFLGLSVLKDSFSGVAESFGTDLLTSDGIGSTLFFIMAGFVATLLTQSSSAAIALILMAAGEAVMGMHAAAAAIIGANIGTTSTAVLAAINATPNARRVAAGHVVFNLVTGILALIILPLLLWFTKMAGEHLGLGHHIVPTLALFHTVFNVFGVMIILPFAGKMAEILGKLFKTGEEDLSRPHYLDRTLSGNPALALSALQKELDRMKDIVCALILSAFEKEKIPEKSLERKAEAVYALGETINEFTINVRMEDMSREASEALPDMIRIARYLEEAARLIPETHMLLKAVKDLPKKAAKEELLQALEDTTGAITIFALPYGQEAPSLDHEEAQTGRQPGHYDAAVIAMDKFMSSYQRAKAGLLKAAATRTMPPERADELLDHLSHMRRMTEQMAKADRMLGNLHSKDNNPSKNEAEKAA